MKPKKGNITKYILVTLKINGVVMAQGIRHMPLVWETQNPL